MMDSDSVVTCSLPSPLIGHQLACMSISWPHDFPVASDYVSFIIAARPAPAAVHHLT